MKVEHEYRDGSKHIFDVEPEDIKETVYHQKHIPEDHGGYEKGMVRLGHFEIPEASYLQKYVICPLCESKIQVCRKKIHEEL